MIKKFFSKNISNKQASDSGMAFVLILLLIGFFTKNYLYYQIAIPALILNMIYPRFFYLFAIVWLGISELMGAIVSKVLLTIIYVLLVIPVGLYRRIIGKDSLRLKDFKNERTSVMIDRDYKFSSQDIEKPY
ncbi:MAG: hypothetical protein HQ521_00550 [Bacteroidetes bacterium]|nr:hypothetical protein [Bacteroidota bacterium]